MLLAKYTLNRLERDRDGESSVVTVSILSQAGVGDGERKVRTTTEALHMVVVPREPSEEMIAAGLEAIRHGDTWKDIVANIYRNMHEAAPALPYFQALPGR